jgi:hypothetical protein
MFNILRKRELQDWASQLWQSPVASMIICSCIGLIAFALTFSTGKPLTIGRVCIGETFVERMQKFEPITAPRFRLNILDATDAPTIDEIELIWK